MLLLVVSNYLISPSYVSIIIILKLILKYHVLISRNKFSAGYKLFDLIDKYTVFIEMILLLVI